MPSTYPDYESLPCLEDDCRPYYNVYKNCTGSSGGDDSYVKLTNEIIGCLCVSSSLYKLDICNLCLEKSMSGYQRFDKQECSIKQIAPDLNVDFRFPNLDAIKSHKKKLTIGISVSVSVVVVVLAILIFIRYRRRRRANASSGENSLPEEDDKEPPSYELATRGAA